MTWTDGSGRARCAGRGHRVEVGHLVHRQLQAGDVVVMNRNPTLHRGSMMAFEAVIVRGSAVRVNPGYITSFNGDFDGDEVNLAVPRCIAARAVARELMSVRRHVTGVQDR